MTDQSPHGNTQDEHELVRYVHERYHEMLLLYAMGLCKRYRMDLSHADDLLQDLYYQIMLKEDLFFKQYGEKGVGYLMRCLANKIVDLGRKHQSLNRLGDVYTGGLPKSSNIYYLCIQEHLVDFLEMIEKILSERDFAVMKAYIFGYKHWEISEQYDIPQNSVGVIIYRSKKIIRNHLGRE
jgi:RNA polymerase sigma factor (sigma-70 family)